MKQAEALPAIVTKDRKEEDGRHVDPRDHRCDGGSVGPQGRQAEVTKDQHPVGADAALSLVARATRPRTIRALRELAQLEAQRRVVEERWDAWWWRGLYQIALSRPVLRVLYGDPAFYAHADVPAATHVYERMRASLGRVLVRDSFMLSLVLTGRLSVTDLPPRLTREGHRRIREGNAGTGCRCGGVSAASQRNGRGTQWGRRRGRRRRGVRGKAPQTLTAWRIEPYWHGRSELRDVDVGIATWQPPIGMSSATRNAWSTVSSDSCALSV